MTIGMGLIDFDANKVLIAADTLVTYGSELKRHAGSKFLETSAPCLIVGAGSIRLSQLFNLLVREQPELLQFKTELDVVALADAFYEKVSAAGVGDAENNDTPNHEFEILIANNLSAKLFIIEGDYSVEEFTNFACIGSGFIQGQAALQTLTNVGIHGRNALDQAMKTVMAMHPHCGGEAEVRELSLEAK
jgi:ATP-dependent protease HslVU (ClpYQ) peptidase subunit